jgi:hypothetical protein
MPNHKGEPHPLVTWRVSGVNQSAGGKAEEEGGEAEEESKEGLFKANTVNEEGWRRQRGMGRGMSRFKTKIPFAGGGAEG